MLLCSGLGCCQSPPPLESAGVSETLSSMSCHKTGSQDRSAHSPEVQKRLKCPPPPGFTRFKVEYEGFYQIFEMKSTKPMRTALHKFAEKINKECEALRFHYEGTRIKEDDTPAALGMDPDDADGNVVDVNLEQYGGTPDMCRRISRMCEAEKYSPPLAQKM
ncbi:hypothetical protein B0H10DRAFT_1977665 [Mycena sp. CBHHK59/15]|nr:hypothetical protein B0H10DRAFT_1977665 [Mycena sp. CBHHK59/15]